MATKSLLSRLLWILTVLVLSGGNGYSLLPVPGAEAQALTKPNIVLILTDDQHIHHLQNMPYLSGQPKGHWVTFTNAFENMPLCCPSRGNILTGQYAHHTGVVSNGSGDKLREDSTIATWLKSAGYQTALIGKYLNSYPFSGKPLIPPGWDYWVAFHEGQDYYNYELYENGTVVSYGSAPQDYSTDVFYNKAISFLDSTSPDQPFFLYFSTQAPHQNFTPAPRHVGVYSSLPIFYGPNFNEADVSDKPAWVRNLPLLTSNTNNGQRKASETLLAVDEAIQGIMNNIEAKGQLDNTVIIFLTDNGFSFGTHRWQEKRCVYEECIKTPLLIRYPWTDTRTESRLVQNVDLAPTIAELAQVSPTHQVDGRSLVPLLNNTATGWRSSILLEMQDASTAPRPFWAVRTLEWKYVELNTTGEKELYDLVNDPYELQNLAGLPEYAGIQSSLASELAALRSSTPTTPVPTATGSTHTPTVTRTPTRTRTPTLVPSVTSTIFTSTSDPAGGVTTTFGPSADAYVRSPAPTTNYGTATTLRAYGTGSSQTNSHLRFSVAGVEGTVQSAKLRLYVTDASAIGGGTLYRTTENGWTESGLNYSNQPPTTGSALAALGPVGAGTWIEMDVSSVVTVNGVYTFGLIGNSSDVAYYASRETANKPELVVASTNGGGVTPTTHVPSPTVEQQTATPTPTPTVTSMNVSSSTPTYTPTGTATTTRTSTPIPNSTSTRTATPTRTPTRTPTGSSTDMIFADGFEGGNLSAWSSSSTDAGDLSVSPAAAMVGSQGLQAVIDDNNAVSVTSDHPNAERRYRARFHFDPNSVSMASGNAHIILRGYSGSSTVALRVEFGFSSSGYQVRAGLVNDGSTWTETSWFTLTDAPHTIELDWRAAAAVGANDGGLTLWIDGVERQNLTGIDNDTRRIDRVLLGALASIDTGTRGTYYFDAFESRRQTYIGP